jgi:nucleoid-associated protein EbfC
MMNIQKMMKQAQDMQNKLASVQARLEEEETEGSSGSGAVKIVMNGKKLVKKVSIDQSAMADREMLEDLIVAAFNDAGNKVDSIAAKEMGALTSGLNLPAGMKLPF